MQSDYKAMIRTVRGWPIPEVNFRDVSTLFESGVHFRRLLDELAAKALEFKVQRIAGIDARGFLLAGGISAITGLPLLMVRKQGKLPPETLQESYALEYGSATIEVRVGSCEKGDRVMLVDDLIATGGTLLAASRLITRMEAQTVLVGAVVDLPELGGSELLRQQGLEVCTLCSFSEDE